jgi:nucleoside-diphosphate-sugar epimerase
MGSIEQPSMTILITGAAGFIGQALTAALIKESPSAKIILTDVVEPPTPSTECGSKPAATVQSLAADLTSKCVCDDLFTSDLTHVYLLHGIMSGAAESNYDLGFRVNVDSMRYVADALTRHSKKVPTKVVFPSSLAVFGPAQPEDIITEDTMPQPQSSYGTEKAMVELLFNDLSRRGMIDVRIVRLPTIIVRPGKPTGAASSFCSGIIREPLNGEASDLPVPTSFKLWVSSTRTVIRNLVLAKDVPAAAFGSGSRIVNLPGITVTVEQMLQTLVEVGGEKLRGLINVKHDAIVKKIVGSWPAIFDVAKAKKLGFRDDVPLSQAIRDYIEDYK